MDAAATNEGQGIARGATVILTSDNTAITVTLGFRPKHVVAINRTDATKLEKIDGMADADTLQTVTAGTQTVTTNSQIVISDNGFVISAAAAGNAKSWAIFAQ